MILESYMNNNIDFILKESTNNLNMILHESFTDKIKTGWKVFCDKIGKIIDTIITKFKQIGQWIKSKFSNKITKEDLKDGEIEDYDYKDNTLDIIRKISIVKGLQANFIRLCDDASKKDNKDNFKESVNIFLKDINKYNISFEDLIKSDKLVKIKVKEKEDFYLNLKYLIKYVSEAVQSLEIMKNAINKKANNIDEDKIRDIREITAHLIKRHTNLLNIYNKLTQSLKKALKILDNKNTNINIEVIKK